MGVTTKPVTIAVPIDVQRLSPNQRLHWAERARLGRQAHLAALFAWRMEGSPTITGPVEVELLVRRARVIDPDNALAAAKSILDALLCRRRTEKGVVEDDSAEFVSYLPVRFQTGAEWRFHPEVVITITPIERTT